MLAAMEEEEEVVVETLAAEARDLHLDTAAEIDTVNPHLVANSILTYLLAATEVVGRPIPQPLDPLPAPVPVRRPADNAAVASADPSHRIAETAWKRGDGARTTVIETDP